MVAKDGAGHRRPRFADGEDALDVAGALDGLARLRVEQDGFDAEERERRRPRLGLDRTGEGAVRDRSAPSVPSRLLKRRADARDDDGPGLGLPVRVHDGALLVPDVFKVPLPGLGVDGLPDAPERADRREVVAFGVLVSQSAEQADGGPVCSPGHVSRSAPRLKGELCGKR